MNEWRHFPPGADHPNARFSAQEREEIRRRFTAGEGIRQLAREKGCEPSTISRIVKEKE